MQRGPQLDGNTIFKGGGGEAVDQEEDLLGCWVGLYFFSLVLLWKRSQRMQANNAN